MEIEIQFIRARKNDSLESQVHDKLERLGNKYDWITKAVVFLKEEKHPQGKDYECEMRLSVPGPQIFAQSQEVNFNKAINETIHDLGMQLEKKKDKMQEKR
ncbi:MAG: HPF/RaiA family ribosome-associated protein [Crocinitomicaceae bacterium]|nr:HPF/RaiA family ribosome-associated protein [Crocinitomicaceae bacterium]